MPRAKRQKKNHAKSQPSAPGNPKLPFALHMQELRKRLFYVVVSIVAWGVVAYAVQMRIVAALLKPAQHQQFIYTSPGGGIDFLFRVCIYTGVALSIPVIVFQLLRYMQPLIKKDAVRLIAWGSVASGFLAIAGMAFGYFVGLPAALHFLLHQFTSAQIHALLTIQSYMSFVTIYILGSALLFQIPLVMVLINRIKPLKPKRLLGFERWVILLSFVAGGIMNPSPRVQDQLLLAGPMILTYQLGILLVWLANRRRSRPDALSQLLQKDAEQRAARQARFAQAQAALQARLNAAPQLAPADAPTTPSVTPAPFPAPTVRTQPAEPSRPRRYVNDFVRRPVGYMPMRRPTADGMESAEA